MQERRISGARGDLDELLCPCRAVEAVGGVQITKTTTLRAIGVIVSTGGCDPTRPPNDVRATPALGVAPRERLWTLEADRMRAACSQGQMGVRSA